MEKTKYSLSTIRKKHMSQVIGSRKDLSVTGIIMLFVEIAMVLRISVMQYKTF